MQYFGFDRPSFGIKTYGFGDSFSPLELFAGGKQGVWYDPSDKSTLFQDVAGTIPVTKDGDPVALMRDKSGNGNHATQTVSTARPVYKTDGVLHWLEFDGVDDTLATGDNLTVNEGFYVCSGLSVTKYRDNAATITVFGVSSGINYQHINLRGDVAARRFGVSNRTSGGTKAITLNLAYELNEKLVISGGHDTDNLLYMEKNSKNKQMEVNIEITEYKNIPIIIGDALGINFYGGVWVGSSLDGSKDVEKYFANKAGVTL